MVLTILGETRGGGGGDRVGVRSGGANLFHTGFQRRPRRRQRPRPARTHARV